MSDDHDHDHDPIAASLRQAARLLPEPPADLAARSLARVHRDRRRRRRLRLVGTTLALAAAAALALVLLMPAHDPQPSGPAIAVTPMKDEGQAPLIAPTRGDDPAPAADLRRILARTTYGGERAAIINDLDGCRAFLLACVPRVELRREGGAE